MALTDRERHTLSMELMKRYCGENWNAEEAIKELAAAGWEKFSFGVWVSPNGHLYRGPALAYAVMKGSELGSDTAVAVRLS